MTDPEKVARGEYPGAPTWTDLEKWAMRARVSIQMDPLPLHGVYECYVRLNGISGSQHSTLRGALYILYHVVHGDLDEKHDQVTP